MTVNNLISKLIISMTPTLKKMYWIAETGVDESRPKIKIADSKNNKSPLFYQPLTVLRANCNNS